MEETRDPVSCSSSAATSSPYRAGDRAQQRRDSPAGNERRQVPGQYTFLSYGVKRAVDDDSGTISSKASARVASPAYSPPFISKRTPSHSHATARLSSVRHVQLAERVSVSIRFDDCAASATLGGVINRFIMRRAGGEGTRPPVKMRPVFPPRLLNAVRRDLNDKVAACARSRQRARHHRPRECMRVRVCIYTRDMRIGFAELSFRKPTDSCGGFMNA